MLTIEIKLNGRHIGGAQVANVSDLANLSDYEVEAVESGSDQTGLPGFYHRFRIRRHKRKQSVWALVRKVAERAEQARECGQGDVREPREDADLRSFDALSGLMDCGD